MRRVAPGPQGMWGQRFFATGRGRGEGGRKMLEDQLGFTTPTQPAARPSAPAPRTPSSAPAPGALSGRGGGRGSAGSSPFSAPHARSAPAGAAPITSPPPPIIPSTGATQHVAAPAPGGRGRGRLPPGPAMDVFARREPRPPRAPGEQQTPDAGERQWMPRRPRRTSAERFSASSRIGDLAAKRAESERPARADPASDELEDDLLDTMSGATKWQAKMQTKVKREALAERKAEGLGRSEKAKKGSVVRAKPKVAAVESDEAKAAKAEKPEEPEAPPALEDSPQPAKDEELDEAAASAALQTPDDSQLIPLIDGLPSPVPSPLSYVVDIFGPALRNTLQKASEEDEEEARKKKEEDDEQGLKEEEEEEDADGNKKKKEAAPEFRLGVLWREERSQDLLFKVGGKKELFAPLAIEAKRAARHSAHYKTLFKEFLPTATQEQKSERRRAVRAKLKEMRNAKKLKPKPAAPAVPVRKSRRMKRSKKRERAAGKFKYHSMGLLGNRLEKLVDQMDEYDDVALQDHLTMMNRALAFNPHWSETQKKTMLDRTTTEFAVLPRKTLEKAESKERLAKWIYSRHWAKLPQRKNFRQAIFKPYSGPHA